MSEELLNNPNCMNQSETLHALTSRIPKDIIPSFDELLNEIHSMRIQCKKDLSGSYELCSLLPNSEGWIFGLYDENEQKELYAFFNADIYFSIKDVLKKVDEMCIDLMNKRYQKYHPQNHS